MNKKQIIDEKELIISQMTKYCEQYKDFFNLDIKLREYSDSLYNFQVNDVHKKRQELIKKIINNKIKNIFGSNFKKELKINLDTNLAFNIADHHQVLNHPFLLSSNIISSINKINKNEKQDAIIVISSGDVPPNNYFSKNGFTFYGKKVPLFSNCERELSSYYIPKRDFNFIEKLKVSDKWKEFNKEEKDFLIKEYDIIKSYNFSRCQNYLDQITVIIKNSWPRLFEEKLRPTLPDLIYITQEEIISECLIEILKEDNIISRCLFDENFRNKILENFRGIVVTWNEKEEKGTHFFWQKNPMESKSLRMYIKEGKLTPIDKRFKDLSIPFEREIIIELLKKKKIYPSLFIIFGVLNFYLGIKPLVGYGSVIYLNLMKNSWIKTLREFNINNEIENIKNIDTNGFVAGLPLIFQKYKNNMKVLYAYDIIYKGGITEDYLNKIFNMKFKDFLSVGVADMYDYVSVKYIPKEIKIVPKINFNDLASITFDKIV